MFKKMTTRKTAIRPGKSNAITITLCITILLLCLFELTVTVTSAHKSQTNTITLLRWYRFADEERPCPRTCPPTFHR